MAIAAATAMSMMTGTMMTRVVMSMMTDKGGIIMISNNGNFFITLMSKAVTKSNVLLMIEMNRNNLYVESFR